jgi:hypothetical protein
LKPFEKNFLRTWFSPQLSTKPLSPQETELKKKREEEKEKLPKSLQIKGEVNILRGERRFNFKNPF